MCKKMMTIVMEFDGDGADGVESSSCDGNECIVPFVNGFEN